MKEKNNHRGHGENTEDTEGEKIAIFFLCALCVLPSVFSVVYLRFLGKSGAR
jgi:hypothetical protein